jgi:hypothetical protein
MVEIQRNCSRCQWVGGLAVLGAIALTLVARSAEADGAKPDKVRPGQAKGVDPIADAKPDKVRPGQAKGVDPIADAKPDKVRPDQAKGVDPIAPAKSLLPAAPKAAPTGWSMDISDLAKVPELAFWDPLPRDRPEATVTRMTAKINAENRHETDRFMHLLVEHRPDLAGLPFVLGKACRLEKLRSRAFASTVNMVQDSLRKMKTSGSLDDFWANFTDDQWRFTNPVAPDWIAGSTASFMQILAPESPQMRQRLVKYLAGIEHPETTRALARLAVFSAETEVRTAAHAALKNRPAKDCTDVLVEGVRYPWPAVTQHALESVIKLKRTDLVPKLVELLDGPDPREPVVKEESKKKSTVVRELVRVNHHRNCLLCHAPGNQPNVTNSRDIVSGAVPLPNQPLPEPSDGYRGSSPDLFVRVDVTYLRQDFSLYQRVENADPWPMMQRFDYLIRNRVLTDAEVKAHAARVEQREPGYLSRYHQAIHAALRDLTGHNPAPNAQAWRESLAQR